MKITSTITAIDLDSMIRNDISLWLTPGSTYPYWAIAPAWRNDFRLATPEDFLEAAGVDDLERLEADHILELEIEV